MFGFYFNSRNLFRFFGIFSCGFDFNFENRFSFLFKSSSLLFRWYEGGRLSPKTLASYDQTDKKKKKKAWDAILFQNKKINITNYFFIFFLNCKFVGFLFLRNTYQLFVMMKVIYTVKYNLKSRARDVSQPIHV